MVTTPPEELRFKDAHRALQGSTSQLSAMGDKPMDSKLLDCGKIKPENRPPEGNEPR